MAHRVVRSSSGRSLDELNDQALRDGVLTPEDFHISRDTLLHQAERAEAAGYRQLAMNFRRAAELSSFSNQEVLDIYTLLRPGRSTYTRLVALASWLEKEKCAPLLGEFVRQAAEIYLERGVFKAE